MSQLQTNQHISSPSEIMARLEFARNLFNEQKFIELASELDVLQTQSLNPEQALLLDIIQYHPGIKKPEIPIKLLLQRATSLLELATAINSSIAKAWVWELMHILQLRLFLFHPALHSSAMAAELFEQCNKAQDALSMRVNNCNVMLRCEMYREVLDTSDRLLEQQLLLTPTIHCQILRYAASAHYYLAHEAGVQLGSEEWKKCLILHEKGMQIAQANHLTQLIFVCHTNLAILHCTIGDRKSAMEHISGLENMPEERARNNFSSWSYWLRLCEGMLLAQSEEWEQGWNALVSMSHELASPTPDVIGVLEITLRTIVTLGKQRGRFEQALEASQSHFLLQQKQRLSLSKTLGETVDEVMELPKLQRQNMQLSQHGHMLENSLEQTNAELRKTLKKLQEEAIVREAAETALQYAHDNLENEVRRQTSELSEAMSLVMQQEKQLALGRIVIGVAHEMNTPLGNARMAASTIEHQCQQLIRDIEQGTLQKSVLEDGLNSIQECCGVTDRSLLRAADLVQRFKALAIGQHNETCVEFNLIEIIHQFQQENQTKLIAAGAKLSLSIPSDLILQGYPKALYQVLDQLLDNSLKHGLRSVKDAQIRLTVSQQGNYFELSFCDNGTGISNENLPRIFEPFFSTQLGSSGTGLGLSIIESLVRDMMGGSIRIENHSSLGTRALLKLPLCAPLPKKSLTSQD